MTIASDYLLIAVIFFLWASLYAMITTLLNKSHIMIKAEERRNTLKQISQVITPSFKLSKRKIRSLLENILLVSQSVVISPIQKQHVFTTAPIQRFEHTLLRRLFSHNRFIRMNAAKGLSIIGSESARKAIERALLQEKKFAMKLYLANALSDIGDSRSIQSLIKSLYGAHFWYRSKVNMLIAGFPNAIKEIGPEYYSSSDIEIRELLVDLAAIYPSFKLKQYIIEIVQKFPLEIEKQIKTAELLPQKCCYYCVYGQKEADDLHRQCPYRSKVANDFHCRRFRNLMMRHFSASNYHRLMVRATQALEKLYPEELSATLYLEHGDKEIQSIAVRSLGHSPSLDHFSKLLFYLECDSTAKAAHEGLSELLSTHSNFIPKTIDAFVHTTGVLHQRLADVLSYRIEYIIAKLVGYDHDVAKGIIDELIRMGHVTEIIEFLKSNKNIELEAELIAIIKPQLQDNALLARECGLFLPDALLEKLGLERLSRSEPDRQEKLNKKMIHWMYGIIAVAVCFFPIIYVVRFYPRIATLSFIENMKYFVLNFNVTFAYYAIAVNLIYLVLLFFSRLNIRREAKLWELKKATMFFKPRMLPSVSIIAPAYNEERTIIQSANSLLNLRYPDHELVIVNDGSKDATLKTLIDYFDLKRTDFPYEQRLPHYPIRGIYTNPSIPNLVVVDKENGGKADTLNAGINVSSKEYFCGIDADSLLESDALLKVAALTLDYGVETPALGGNVFPINGCKVDKGKIERIGVPNQWLARLQSVEYMRAFMCGRLGWDYLNSLLIISGAFGLFRKERIVEVGGYLTSKSQYQRDTVGEDMELVVRIARSMHEAKRPYRISYAFNANCWTEVPEKLSSLKKQRYRWQRGLVDIMHFHKKLIFNPKYGLMGILAMPYFLIFEMIGPLFEIQGYVMVFLAAIFGILSARIALLLFFGSVLMGIFISIMSLKTAERHDIYYDYRDTFRLIGTAIVENFGPRQLFSTWRASGFVKAMQKPQGWQKFERKGFVGKEPSAASTEGIVHL